MNKLKKYIKKIKMAAAAAILLFVSITIQSCSAQNVGVYDLISLINGQRAANGLGALATDANLMACAQGTAETMAASQMTWHIGNASGRASAYGYNGGNICFATENFMMGTETTTMSDIVAAWSDGSHMIASTDGRYCHIGAGVASNGTFTYFVVQAAYPGDKTSCAYSASTGTNAAAAGVGVVNATVDISQIIKKVAVAEPDEDGLIHHQVQDGQSLWSIGAAYDVSLDEIRAWNNMGTSSALSVGQTLVIPGKDYVGKTPTPQVELTVFPTANASGVYIHEVKDGETLWSISELWHVSLSEIYRINGLSEDSNIGLNWKIRIPVTPTVTPLPTNTPLPTFTPSPTNTSTSIPEPNHEENALPTEEVHRAHLPSADKRTYMILGIGFILSLGIALVAWGKKMK